MTVKTADWLKLQWFLNSGKMNADLLCCFILKREPLSFSMKKRCRLRYDIIGEIIYLRHKSITVLKVRGIL